MLLAINSSNQYCFANLANREESYRCPACKESVVLRHGQQNVAHFAHQVQASCHSFTEGETIDHLLGKMALYRSFAKDYQVVVEPVLGQISQRPDLLVKRPQGPDLAIEYQCSPIGRKRLQERNQGLKSLGLEVLWVLGPAYYQRRLSGELICRFLYCGRLFFYVPKQKRFDTRFNFSKTDFHKLHYQNQIGFPAILSSLANGAEDDHDKPLGMRSASQPVLYQTKLVNPTSNLAQHLLYQRTKLTLLMVQGRVNIDMINYLYERGQRLDQIPDWCLLGQVFGLAVPNWYFRLVLVLLLEKVGLNHWIFEKSLSARLRQYFYPSFQEPEKIVKATYTDLAVSGVICLQDNKILVIKLLQFVAD
ncbi:competence protein CoiA [Fructobacillus evanidus]|uniref:Contains predicted nuclease domain (CoiA) n=1 Tax=Fructobacillus evanidus TaxID=3064281 RepID=A0ABN9YSM2_9LACO|nr:Competence protein CoiA [Fructobacillus sp. LMG 32999]CAK1237002.1 Competence protein CoiA [Fructobacillus sp. LMG 32999]CAK1241892.1 Competence protein CoiA [Fructobacillus sp. LMG 32999]CAK1244486.1 Competence protein CoiA [Fructobacillus sp. LMG 32999]CAK1246992.1 Competence protein CoiA [Fructobacillus sp. LMG 32999]